ncbi:class I SAM-dependent methyltransferase [Chryseobacterium sp. SNU WT5]|uniref:class I SAM-dependent methyltransferase n=1 Tax=Chryseobacterium sp. SNU WT5 TaxID=2594269 RepID=UPI00117F3FC8|nr:class I SAM-dependent methyltransferase [Chryseobacterium sp. SNU WT5]QDP85314.1 class I SAM-dependent methyltransferase [Chryseobacterium sp. SNU WT5]
MKVTDHFLTKEEFKIVETDISGLYKTTPVPNDLSKYYESTEYISHHQDSGSLKERLYKLLQNFNLKYKKNIIHSHAPTAKRVLDYGCGAGEFIKYIENDYETFGLEPNSVARTNALAKLKSTSIISDLKSMKDDGLDVITLWHVFEHIENQNEVLKEFHKKLQSKGILIIAVPNLKSYDAQKYKEYWAAYDVPRHAYHFSKKGMENVLKKNNFEIEKIKPLLLDSFYISMLSEKYRKSSLFWLKGFIFGLISNIKASKSGEFSSLIYIIRKK